MGLAQITGSDDPVIDVVAETLRAVVAGADPPPPYAGQGSCYIEFGSGHVGRIDIDFLSGPNRTGVFQAPSAELIAEKQQFGASRRARWFAHT